MKSFLSAASVSLSSILLALFLVQPADAGVPVTPPEALLAEDSALYFRFDGLKAHRTAYEKTIFSRLMKDELGPLVQFIARALFDELGPELVVGQLVDGLEPDQLLELYRAVRILPLFAKYLDEHGIVIGLELGKKPKLKQQMTFVFPNGADPKYQSVLFGVFRLFVTIRSTEVTTKKEAGRSILIGTDEFETAACW